MPPRQRNKASRVPSIAAKMANLSGVNPEEKHLLLRIGSLIDAFVTTQRNVNNPGEIGPRQLSNRVPKVSNLDITPVPGGVDVTWDAVDFNFFDHYETEYDVNTTFPDPVNLPVFTNKISIKGITADTIAVRVRVVDRIGRVGLWESTETTPLAGAILFSTDGDAVEFENRTKIDPQPVLLGGSLSTDFLTGGVVGTGGAVGPGPSTFYDPTGRPGLINQITYTLVENGLIASQEVTMWLPTLFYEKGDTTTDVRGREYMSFPGSFVDFFEPEEFDFDPAVMDVVFLEPLQTPEEQMGIVNNATMGIIKL